MSRYLSGGSPVASALVYQFVNGSAQITTSSATFVTTSLSITVLQTGTYKIDSNASVRIGNSGSLTKTGETGIFVNGTQVPNTTSRAGTGLAGISLATNSFDGNCTSFVVTALTAGDVVDLRYRLTSGSTAFEMTDRQLMITKVG